MEEEKKVAEVEEVQQKEEVKEEQGGMTPNCKYALISFILACVAFFLALGWWVGAIGGIVCGILSLVFLKKINGEVEKQPFRTFAKIAKILGLVMIIFSAVMFLVYFILFLVSVIGAAVVAAEEAARYVAVLF